MTRTLNLTAAEREVLQRDGTAWIVLEGDLATSDVDAVGRAFAAILNHGRGAGLPHLICPPAELVAAAAPCPERYCDHGTVLYPEWEGRAQPCPDCRITLMGECPTCMGSGCIRGGYPDYDALDCSACSDGTATLGYAYADSEVLHVTEALAHSDGGCWVHVPPHGRRHFPIHGDPAALVGRYALKVRLA